jgi:hypothetical protein
MYLSCWHYSQHESAAMWSLYQRDGYGIAVRSTFRRLTESFKSERLIYAGLVKYVDFDTSVIPDDNSYAPYLYKRLSFEHEHEMRAVTADMGTALKAWQEANGPKLTTGLGQDIGAELKELEDAYRALGPELSPRPGVLVPVDLDRLVVAVYIAPEAAGWFSDLVEKLLRRYRHDWPVLHSDLSRDPVY